MWNPLLISTTSIKTAMDDPEAISSEVKAASAFLHEAETCIHLW